MQKSQIVNKIHFDQQACVEGLLLNFFFFGPKETNEHGGRHAQPFLIAEVQLGSMQTVLTVLPSQGCEPWDSSYSGNGW